MSTQRRQRPKRNARELIPVKERCKHLYAMGYTLSEIYKILEFEFEEILLAPLVSNQIRFIIENNKEEFDEYKMQMALSYRDSINDHMIQLYSKSQATENKLVDVYLEKQNALLDEFRKLDPGEKSPEGNFVNTSRMFVIMEAVEKMHKFTEKITGTAMLREVEAMRQKLEIKAQLDAKANAGALGGAYDVEAEGIPTTKFID